MYMQHVKKKVKFFGNISWEITVVVIGALGQTSGGFI